MKTQEYIITPQLEELVYTKLRMFPQAFLAKNHFFPNERKNRLF